MAFTVDSDWGQDFTLISDSFISNYMPAANGNYVKIYIYLQMLSKRPDTCADITVNKLADVMECTENDILRALRYWKKQGLLDLTENNGEISRIQMGTLPAESEVPVKNELDEAAAGQEEASDAVDGAKAQPVPKKQNYTPLQAEALRKDIEIDKAINRVEALLGEPVSPSHLQLILYFMCDIGFTADLLVTLYETALHKGKKKTSYIEAIGISWAKKGIHTPEEAKAESESFSGRYALVTRTLGSTDKLAPVHKQMIDSWEDYHFDDNIVEEACRRTALQTGGGLKNLPYVSAILKKWNDRQIHSMEDIEKNDANYKHQKKNKTAKPPAGKNQFQKFPQRAYSAQEVSSLEQRLLQKQ